MASRLSDICYASGMILYSLIKKSLLCVKVYHFYSMDRLLHVFFIVFFIFSGLQAQSFSTCAEILASGGGSNTVGNRYFAYTIGEPVVVTQAGQARVMTQGFHQPEICKLVAVHDLDIEALQLSVFPNPASHQFNIRYKTGISDHLEARVFDLWGRIQRASFPLTSGNHTIICQDWVPGIYFLQIFQPDNGASAIVRIVLQ